MNTAILLLSYIAFSSSQWVTKKSLPFRRSDTGCSLSGEKIYITGGCASDQVYEPISQCNSISNSLFAYSPETDEWDTLENMPRIRFRHSSVATDGKIYIFGGVDDQDVIVPQVDIYDITTGKWSTLPSTFTEASTDATAFVLEKKIVIVGGYGRDYIALGNTHYFDIPTQTFTYNVTHMNQPRGDICSGVIDGKAYVYGGYQSDFCNPVGFLEELNFGKSSWTEKAKNEIPSDTTGGTKGDKGCFVMNEQFFAVGGEEKTTDCFSQALYDADSYNPEKNEWKTEPTLYLTQPRFRFCIVAYENKVYRFGGQGPLFGAAGEEGHQILDEVEVYTFNSSSLLSPFFALLMISILFYFFI